MSGQWFLERTTGGGAELEGSILRAGEWRTRNGGSRGQQARGMGTINLGLGWPCVFAQPCLQL